MKILKLIPLSPFSTNSYLVVTEKNNAFLIDAPENGEYILGFARENGCEIKKILLTHGHCDHIGAAAEIQNMTDCEVYIHKNDALKLSDSYGNLTDILNLKRFDAVKRVNEVTDGDKITLDEITFEVIHTPGHTSGCVCYAADDVMFSGDTLFNLSIGRTDMPDGSMTALSKSLSKLKEIKKDYTVYPGHMEATTLDFEKKNNPYLY